MSKSYKRRRRENYPQIGEQLDAVWKALDHLAWQGIELPSDTLAVLDQVKVVKTDNPKREES